ncbi:9771_t:CDS:2 [Diversispora eburnea]|uniref:9771_t:CDS:1 n=1 Tax=Diversispora eburnea TaxID=1213867 RepID=A0A9N9BRW9_9GLOM|nr:9771_t:CDS:2 [Diversispora eburnea]
MIILLLDFVNPVNAAGINLRGVCTADAGKIASLKIGPPKNFDLQVSFTAKTYTRGTPVLITIDVNKDEIDAMLIYAFGKGDDKFRVGITCGSTQADQNSTVVAVGQLATVVTLNWYPPNSSGNGDISFRALVINKNGYELITTNSLADSTHSPVSTNVNTATITKSSSAASTKSQSLPSKTSISKVTTNVPDPYSNAISDLSDVPNYCSDCESLSDNENDTKESSIDVSELIGFTNLNDTITQAFIYKLKEYQLYETMAILIKSGKLRLDQNEIPKKVRNMIERKGDNIPELKNILSK